MRRVWLIPDHQMNGAVSHQPGVIKSVNLHAEQIGVKAEARLDQHRDEGNARIEVDHNIPGLYGQTDSLVALVDEPHTRSDGSRSEGNAMAIEFGHKHNYTGKPVQGLYILYGASGLI